MEQYLSLVSEILEHGEEKRDRTGVGTISLFGAQRKYDLRQGFPLLTTKRVLYDAVLRELLWFLRGSTNINDDLKQYTPIWNAWADPDGELGPVYGYQWRKWEKFEWDAISKKYRKSYIDQIQNVIDAIRQNPDSRRLIVNAWNVADLDRMKLPPCHLLFQFYVAPNDSREGMGLVGSHAEATKEGGASVRRSSSEGGPSVSGGNVVAPRLDLQLYQRSADMALGVPFNIASYAALLSMIARECDLIPGIFTHTLGDAHIYVNHIEGLREQLKRKPYPLPTLKIADKPFWDLKFKDFTLENYQHHDLIKFKVAI